MDDNKKIDFFCSESLKIAHRVCRSNIPFDEFVRVFFNGAHAWLDKYEINDVENDHAQAPEIPLNNFRAPDIPPHIGVPLLKKKDTKKSGRKRRYPSCLEKIKKKKTTSQMAVRVAESQPNMGMGCSLSQPDGDNENLLRLTLFTQ